MTSLVALREVLDSAIKSNEAVAASIAEAIGLTPAAAKDLRAWRENSRSRLRKGLRPRRFVSDAIPAALAEVIWTRLEGAHDRASVDAAFTFGGHPAT